MRNITLLDQGLGVVIETAESMSMQKIRG